ncbi:hypothetical protein HMSSN139_40210 [Paenibacillus sp. HMSSN-139]|nr:hypothetical protein HMSSN139_40210 [Paenibacillus sp. HMSSN-139]
MTLDYATSNYIPLLTLLGNLTANAVEAIQGRGQIHLEVREQAGWTLLTVSDSGNGFPRDEREMVLEPGFTTKFDEEGVAATGIGFIPCARHRDPLWRGTLAGDSAGAGAGNGPNSHSDAATAEVGGSNVIKGSTTRIRAKTRLTKR